VVLEGPAVITAARRKAAAEAKAALAASIKVAPGDLEREPESATGRPASAAVAKSAIVTVRRKAARILPLGLLPETPEEHRRRGDAADDMFQEMKRWIAEKLRGSS
jgi:hypothetical protein